MSKETKNQVEEIKQIDTSKVAADIDNKVQQDEIVTLPNGTRVRYSSVAPDLLRKVQEKIPNPTVPTFPHPDDPERTIENPMHPDYLEAVRQTNIKRTDALIQAMVLMGIELVDGMPKNDDWLENLIYLGLIDEADVDSANDKLREIWYKRFIAIDAVGFEILNQKSGLSEEKVAQARNAFQRNS